MNNKFHHRTKCVYDDKELLGCFLFYGDGKYISKRKNVLFGATQFLIDNIDSYDDLIKVILNIPDFPIIEDDLLQVLSNYTLGLSNRYNYPFHKTNQYVFRTILMNNQLTDIREVILGENDVR